MTGETESTVWIRTEPSLDGSTYMVAVEVSDDRSIPLTPETAPRYAITILEAVARAEYDAAMFRQMSELIGDRNHVVRFIQDLRQDRPDIDYSATEPLRIEPGVNSKGEPFLYVRVDEKLLGQWTMAGAREHVLTALQVTAVADLDAGYYRALTGLVGLDPERARTVVHHLGNYRPEVSSS